LCSFLPFLVLFSETALADQKHDSAHFTLVRYRFGFGVAAECMSAQANLKVRPERDLGNISSTQQQAGRKIQLAPSIEFGATMWDDYYLGLFLSWRNSSSKTSSHSSIKGTQAHFSHRFKIKSYLNIFAKMGYKLTPRSMVYGLVGPSVASWRHITEQLSIAPATQVSHVVDTFKMRGNTVGLGMGIGLEHMIRGKYALSFDYVYHFHRSKKQSYAMTYDDVSLRGLWPRSGNLIKIVQPSYSTLALRLTFFM
jgi:opacity protein-like surface antigen